MANISKVILQTRVSTCSFPESLVTQTLKGIKRIMTATPAKMDTPMVLYRKYKETLICSGANHTSFNSIISSNSRCVSTDIKVTISPAVDSLREALPKRRAWGKKENCEDRHIRIGGRQTDRQTDSQTGRQADRQTGRQAGRQAGRKTDRQAGRQAGR